MQTGEAIVESSMDLSQKVKNRTTIQISNSTSEYLSEEKETAKLKRYMHPYVHCSKPRCLLINEWLNKM